MERAKKRKSNTAQTVEHTLVKKLKRNSNDDKDFSESNGTDSDEDAGELINTNNSIFDSDDHNSCWMRYQLGWRHLLNFFEEHPHFTFNRSGNEELWTEQVQILNGIVGCKKTSSEWKKKWDSYRRTMKMKLEEKQDSVYPLTAEEEKIWSIVSREKRNEATTKSSNSTILVKEKSIKIEQDSFWEDSENGSSENETSPIIIKTENDFTEFPHSSTKEISSNSIMEKQNELKKVSVKTENIEEEIIIDDSWSVSLKDEDFDSDDGNDSDEVQVQEENVDLITIDDSEEDAIEPDDETFQITVCSLEEEDLPKMCRNFLACWKHLLQFFEIHPQLVHILESKGDNRAIWAMEVIKLNQLAGTKKTPGQWRKYWNNFKYKFRKKVIHRKKMNKKLTQFEKHFLKIVGDDDNPNKMRNTKCLNHLLSFLEKHPEFSCGYRHSHRREKSQLFKDEVRILNLIDGKERTEMQWLKKLSHIKWKLKMNLEEKMSLGQPLTESDKRIYKIINWKKEDSRKTITRVHWRQLETFFKSHAYLVHCRVATMDEWEKLWDKQLPFINKITGLTKTSKQWMNSWNNYKAHLARKSKSTSKEFTALERRYAAIIESTRQPDIDKEAETLNRNEILHRCWEHMTTFFEKHRHLLKFQLNNKAWVAVWDAEVKILNSISGFNKNKTEWGTVWSNCKRQVRQRHAKNPSDLTDLDKRILALCREENVIKITDVKIEETELKIEDAESHKITDEINNCETIEIKSESEGEEDNCEGPNSPKKLDITPSTSTYSEQNDSINNPSTSSSSSDNSDNVIESEDNEISLQKCYEYLYHFFVTHPKAMNYNACDKEIDELWVEAVKVFNIINGLNVTKDEWIQVWNDFRDYLVEKSDTRLYELSQWQLNILSLIEAENVESDLKNSNLCFGHLLWFFQEHPELCGSFNFIESNQEVIAEEVRILNKLGGFNHSVKEWKYVWEMYKCKIKCKLDTGDGALTDLEMKVADLMDSCSKTQFPYWEYLATYFEIYPELAKCDNIEEGPKFLSELKVINKLGGFQYNRIQWKNKWLSYRNTLKRKVENTSCKLNELDERFAKILGYKRNKMIKINEKIDSIYNPVEMENEIEKQLKENCEIDNDLKLDIGNLKTEIVDDPKPETVDNTPEKLVDDCCEHLYNFIQKHPDCLESINFDPNSKQLWIQEVEKLNEISGLNIDESNWRKSYNLSKTQNQMSFVTSVGHRFQTLFGDGHETIITDKKYIRCWKHLLNFFQTYDKFIFTPPMNDVDEKLWNAEIQLVNKISGLNKSGREWTEIWNLFKSWLRIKDKDRILSPLHKEYIEIIDAAEEKVIFEGNYLEYWSHLLLFFQINPKLIFNAKMMGKQKVWKEEVEILNNISGFKRTPQEWRNNWLLLKKRIKRNSEDPNKLSELECEFRDLLEKEKDHDILNNNHLLCWSNLLTFFERNPRFIHDGIKPDNYLWKDQVKILNTIGGFTKSEEDWLTDWLNYKNYLLSKKEKGVKMTVFQKNFVNLMERIKHPNKLWEILLDFYKKNTDFEQDCSNPHDKLWAQLVTEISGDSSISAIEKYQKMWFDYKTNFKQKIYNIRKSKEGINLRSELDEFEYKIYEMLEDSDDCLPDLELSDPEDVWVQLSKEQMPHLRIVIEKDYDEKWTHLLKFMSEHPELAKNTYGKGRKGAQLWNKFLTELNSKTSVTRSLYSVQVSWRRAKLRVLQKVQGGETLSSIEEQILAILESPDKKK